MSIKNSKEKAIYLDTYKYNKIGYSNGEMQIVVEKENGDATITVMNNH